MSTINHSQSLLNHIRRILQQLYRINIADIPPEDQPAHRQALHEAYLALMRYENAEFQKSLQASQTQLDQLQQQTQKLVTALEEEKKTVDKIKLAARGLELLKKLVI